MLNPEETRLSVKDYEAARGSRFLRERWHAVAAAAIYAMAYLVRCAHAQDPETGERGRLYRDALFLFAHTETYFRPGASFG